MQGISPKYGTSQVKKGEKPHPKAKRGGEGQVQHQLPDLFCMYVTQVSVTKVSQIKFIRHVSLKTVFHSKTVCYTQDWCQAQAQGTRRWKRTKRHTWRGKQLSQSSSSLSPAATQQSIAFALQIRQGKSRTHPLRCLRAALSHSALTL